MKDLYIYCADIGSVKKGRFAWYGGLANGKKQGGSSIQALVEEISSRLRAHHPVALGIECPLFVIIPDDPILLTEARPGEGNRAWSAGAGAGALATGLTETVWILRGIRRLTSSNLKVFLDLARFKKKANGLFLWEAFVSGKGKGGSHEGDAKKAVDEFIFHLPNIDKANAIVVNNKKSDIHSLIGAAIIRSGLSDDISLLKYPCIVIKTA
jgi:hypothetical protein